MQGSHRACNAGKKRFGGRLTALALAAVMVFAMLPAAAFAAGTHQASTYAQLVAAVEDPDCTAVQIKKDIVIEDVLTITHSMRIEGGGFTLSVPEPGLLASGVLNDDPSDFGVFVLDAAGAGISVSMNDIKLQGGKSNAVNVARGVTATLSRVSITNSGGEDEAGGGIANYGTLTLCDSVINRNAAPFGGGFLNNGIMTAENCSFSENRSLRTNGGGGAGQNNKTLYVNNCTFSNNKSTELGGAINDTGYGMAYIMNSTFAGNVSYSAYSEGGALRGEGSVVVNCLFAYNYDMAVADGDFDLSEYSSRWATNKRQINCIFHGDTFSANQNRKYDGAADGTDDALFAGGMLTKVLDASGVQTGTGEAYQPYLFTPAGEFTSVVPLAVYSDGISYADAYNGGIPTSFDPFAAEPIFAYYDTSAGVWMNITQNSIAALSGDAAAAAAAKEVTTDQYGSARGSVIGSTALEESNLYMVRLIYDPATAHGVVHGVTIYGDIYKGGDIVTMISTPDNGYYLENWTQHISNAALSPDNPYRHTVSGNVDIYPKYTDERPPQQAIPTTLTCVVSPESVDLNTASTSEQDISVTTTLTDAGGNPLSGKNVTFYVLNARGQIIHEETLLTDAQGGAAFAEWTPTISGEYTVLASFTGEEPYSASRAEKSVPVYYQAYTINYDTGAAAVSQSLVPCGTDVYVAMPVRSGYIFTGWTVSGAAAGASYGVATANTPVPDGGVLNVTGGIYVKDLAAPQGAVTLTASWAANTYTVEFDLNAYRVPDDNDSFDYTIPITATTGVPFEVPAPNVTNFDGWRVNGANWQTARFGVDQSSVDTPVTQGAIVSNPAGGSLWFKDIVGSGTVTLYAQSIGDCTIDIIVDGVPYTGAAALTNTNDATDVHTLTAESTPGRYSTAVGGGNTYALTLDGAYTNFSCYLEDVVQSADLCTVTLHTNNGPNDPTMTVYAGAYSYFLLDKVPAITNQSKRFAGWYESSDLSGSKVEYLQIATAKHLYAGWVDEPDLLTFSIAGIANSTGVINAANKTVTVIVPAGTDRSSLKPVFTTTTGAYAYAEGGVYPGYYEKLESGVTVKDFSSPVEIVISEKDDEYAVSDDVNFNRAALSIYTVSVRALPGITAASLPKGTVDGEYYADLGITSDTPATVDITGLPRGMYVANGKLRGRPTEDGTFSVRVTAENAAGTAQKTFSLTVEPAFVSVTDIVLTGSPRTQVNAPFTLSAQVLPANATNKDIIWTVSAPGSTNAGVVNGVFTATAAGTATVTATILSGKLHPTLAGITQNYTKTFDIIVTDAAPVLYTLTVNNGTGSGSYAEGDSVTVTPTPPSSRHVFLRWDAVRYSGTGLPTPGADGSMTFLMPGSDVELTAVFALTPAITMQPGNVSVQVGQDAVFTIMASDATDYQWQRRLPNVQTWEIIAGANSSSYTVSRAALTDHGTQFCCVASNNVGRVTSAVAVLSVTDRAAPIIYTQPETTVYNGKSAADSTIWLTGRGLLLSDRLIVRKLTSGSVYKSMLSLANGDDVFNVYDISLESGMKSTGYPLYLHFDLAEKYAGQTFTLAHMKADGSVETFHATADAKGDLVFGPIYSLSPFMLVKGMSGLTADTLQVPDTGSAPSGWTLIAAGLALLAAAGAVMARRKRD